MSNIFDALQRSEAEQTGLSLSTLATTTELLRRAERQAVSKWEIAVGEPIALEGTRVDSQPRMQAAVPLSIGVEAPVADQLSAVDDHSRMEVLGRFPSLQISPSAKSRLVCLTEKDSPAAEAFRFLGVRLRHLRRDRPLKKVLITSTIPQEGKSMVAGNLACVLALGTQPKTLLLEGDVRRPALSRMFGLKRVPGLCECLQGERSLEGSVYRLDEPRLWILPAGNAKGNPLELLQSGRLSVLMEQLGKWFDWIVIDSPPVLPIADTSVWTRMADGILLVTRQGITEKKQLTRGLESLEQRNLIGAVLNSSENSTYSDYYYSPRAALRSSNSSTQ